MGQAANGTGIEEHAWGLGFEVCVHSCFLHSGGFYGLI